MKHVISTVVVAAWGAFLIVGAAGPAAAGLKSGKINTTLTNPANTAGAFTNGTSKGTFSFKGTKATIKAKGTTVADTDGAHCTGDEVICLISVNVGLNFSAPTTMVVMLMGEASGGKIIASHDFCKDRDDSVDAASSFFCPEFFGAVSPIALSSVEAVCYAPDSTWVAAHTPDLPMALTGHSCEGVLQTPPMSLPSTVLFSSGSTLLVP